MAWRTLAELLHMAVGLLLTGVLAGLAAWAVPNARDSIAIVAWIVAGAVVVTGVRPVMRAWATDRAVPRPGGGGGIADD